MGSFNEVALTVKMCERSDADRMKGVRVCTDGMRALSAQAISLESAYHQELQRADVYLATGENKLYAMSLIRAKTLHGERCETLKRVAVYARIAMLDALGTLAIDETTAATGLDEQDRRTVSEVSGRCSRW